MELAGPVGPHLGVAILTPLFRRTSSATTLLDEAPDPEAIEELTPSPLD
ncbi:MAG: hypothetical protein OEW91_14420 [Acidimicrobiia bacterium]|nr:hypothetical protein [Acidimicrobiia bacterium]